MFLDEAVVEFISGKGGSGAVSFHREKHVPRGGPNGADGGRGGDIVLLADRNQRTLYDFKLHPRHIAKDGVHGLGNKRGKDGKGLVIKLPVGTIIYDDELGEPIADLNAHGMKFLICRGGKGGFGNEHYTNSVRQAPNFAQKGAPGERVLARLQLKLLADVGLVGKPNAGKSTLISRISAARPKIADYPFTTIVPNLGVVRHFHTSFTVADMPGLIEGASEGIGLGHQFLKHVERCRILVHVVDAFPSDESDPLENFHMIEEELRRYSAEIHARPRIIALNKVDLLPFGEHGKVRQQFEDLGFPLYPISAVSGEGLDPLLWELVTILDQPPIDAVETITPVLVRPQGTWAVEKVEDGFKVTGQRIEKLVAMTDLENDEAVRYLHRRLTRLGIIDKLREEGAEEGDLVMIGDFDFGFTDEE